MSKNRRTRLDIQATILSALALDSLSVNKIITHANLNRKRAKDCVRVLSGGGFIEVHDGGRFESYSTTQKGIDWLNRYKGLVRELTSGTNPTG